MNGVHDMGGMHGFGSVEPEEHEPVFHEPWEGRVYGMRRILGSRAGGRPGIENLDPAVYLASSYYEKWLRATEASLVAKGILTAEELEAKTEFFRHNPDASVPSRKDPEMLERIAGATYAPQRLHREVGIVPRFAVGDRVRARNMNPPGHTRLPRYVRGKIGLVTLYHGVHDFQDAVPAGTDPKPQPVYNVRFDAGELWGREAEANQSLQIDMWESYLEPAAG